jgi:ATP-dependent protease HslVU (ClpYQ) peptidase subunit
MKVASDMCVYTNDNYLAEIIEATPAEPEAS